MHGFGVFYQSDGSVYTGEFRNGERTGQAEFKNSERVVSGMFYEGFCVKGTLKMNDGSSYEGDQSLLCDFCY